MSKKSNTNSSQTTWKERQREINKKKALKKPVQKRQQKPSQQQQPSMYEKNSTPTTFLGCVDDNGILDAELWKEVAVDNGYSYDDYTYLSRNFYR